MPEWVSFKEFVAAASGLDSGALHVLASLVLSVFAAAVSRRPLSSIVPWAIVLGVELVNEGLSGFADGIFESWELTSASRDLLLVMVAPSFLLFLCRYLPQLTRPEPSSQIYVPVFPPYRDAIVDADFEEVK